MDERLLKSYDNIMEQQNKMDNKAYIFIGFTMAIFMFLYTKNESKLTSECFIVLIAIPLFFSLLPVTNKILLCLLDGVFRGQCAEQINIFYYADLFKLSNEKLVEKLGSEYEMTSIVIEDKKLIDQIIINSKILRVKVLWHYLSFYIGLGGICFFLLHLIIEYLRTAF